MIFNEVMEGIIYSG